MKKNIIISVLLVFASIAVILISGCSSTTINKNSCLQNQAALDFGSGTTKALVAEIDSCNHKINKIIFQEDIAIPFNEALEKNSSKNIPEEFVTGELPKIKTLVDKVKDFKPVYTFSVATSVFRVAKNGLKIATILSEKLQLSIQVISQVEEAELGYYSVLSSVDVSKNKNVIVWDIGGGSMQMYTLINARPVIFEGNLASVSFKNLIIEKIQHKNAKTTASPNPIGSKSENVLKLSKNHAKSNVQADIKNIAKESAWYGIGGVLYHSVQGQVNKGHRTFSQSELTTVFKTRSKLRDQDIDSEYKSTDISNLGLVLGYMKELNINEIQTIKAPLGQGLLYKKLINNSRP